MAAIFVSQNNETAAMFVSQTSPVGVEHFSYQSGISLNLRTGPTVHATLFNQ